MKIGYAQEDMFSTRRMRRLAYGKVNHALKTGRLLRPVNCEKCGQDPGKDSLGRSRLDAHHHKGHGFPLEVIWLCDGCHKKITPSARGERNGAAKLTAKQVLQIKYLLLEGRSKPEIARWYGVTQHAIKAIRQGTNWGHVS